MSNEIQKLFPYYVPKLKSFAGVVDDADDVSAVLESMIWPVSGYESLKVGNVNLVLSA